jgi:hypothetical protein
MEVSDGEWDCVGDLFEARKQRNRLQAAVDRLLHDCDEADQLNGLLPTSLIRRQLQGVAVVDVKLPEGDGDEQERKAQ